MKNKQTKVAKVTRAALKRQILELRAQMPSAIFHAERDLGVLSIEQLMGSGVVLQMTHIGGKQALTPVMIRDGLSPGTIAAIRKDLKRSNDQVLELNDQALELKLTAK
jgi:hypothetical protein